MLIVMKAEEVCPGRRMKMHAISFATLKPYSVQNPEALLSYEGQGLDIVRAQGRKGVYDRFPLKGH